jgi:hypothetical protein
MTAPSPTNCSVCGRKFPLAELDITADGPRCFACGQAAAVRQFKVDRAAEIASHNRTVLAFSGGSLWRLAFHCSGCNARLDSTPPLLAWRGPPVEIACPTCGTKHRAPFTFRVRWYASLYARLLVPVALLLELPRFSAVVAAGGGAAGIATVAVLALGTAALASALLAVPAALLSGRPPRD